MKKHNLALQPGDAILINTGWNKLWAKDNARYNKSCPGIGIKAAEWLIAKDPMLLGSDNWPVEVAPNPDPLISLPVHQIALVGASDKLQILSLVPSGLDAPWFRPHGLAPRSAVRPR